eukprot:749884-Hanusia_phi.AAC.3
MHDEACASDINVVLYTVRKRAEETESGAVGAEVHRRVHEQGEKRGSWTMTYETMRDDAVRTTSYHHAIKHLVRDRVVLDIGTGALALLAIFAAEAGARKVL